MKGFLRRHPTVTARLASNIKRARAEVSEGTSSDQLPLREGNCVLVRYNESTYPGLVVCIDGKEAEIDCMEKAGNHWKWPGRKDILRYPLEDILMKIKPPKAFNKRGFFVVDEINSLNYRV